MADTSEIYARMAWEVLKRLLTSAHTVQSLADLTCIPVRRVRYLAEDPVSLRSRTMGGSLGRSGSGSRLMPSPSKASGSGSCSRPLQCLEAQRFLCAHSPISRIDSPTHRYRQANARINSSGVSEDGRGRSHGGTGEVVAIPDRRVFDLNGDFI